MCRGDKIPYDILIILALQEMSVGCITHNFFWMGAGRSGFGLWDKKRMVCAEVLMLVMFVVLCD